MAGLPTGTVTFLFSDIEGSTRLLQELGDRYAAVRDEHAAILRRAVAGAGGVEVSTEGDSFFVAFASPQAAVRAAVATQRGLAAHDWPPGRPVRVRMGLHTGEGVLGGDNYVGLDVHRAARIAGAAHGGQVLVSDATRALVDHGLPDGASLRDLGEHRLKDIARPERLHDLVIEGLRADFPPPRTLDARRDNLPPQLTSFVGRQEEIAEVSRLLGRARLLTLSGPGGTGKSRLALQVAAELLAGFGDGAFFVDLSSVTDPALVPSVVAQVLGVPEVAGRPILEAVRDRLRNQELLLVVDNFEQVVEAAPLLEELLTAAPALKVLVTSRVVLSLRGEQEYVVPPLELPDPERLPDLPALGRVEAVRLFTERAQAVRPGFRLTEENAPAVAEICARLDGLPLAIELAATRTKVLSPEQLLARLQQRLALLTSGARTLPERQRTLRAAIAWSYDLLEAAERRLLARLSVFSGGWTLASAEAVCDPQELGLDALEGLASLVDQSLVRQAEPGGGEARFALLETIREFGHEQLRAGGSSTRSVGATPGTSSGWPWPPSPTSPPTTRSSGWTGVTGSIPTFVPPSAGPSRPARPTGPRRPRERCGGSGSSAGTWPRAASGSRRSCRRRRGRPGRRCGPRPGRSRGDRLVAGGHRGRGRVLRGGPGHRAGARRPRRDRGGPVQPGVRGRRRGRLRGRRPSV